MPNELTYQKELGVKFFTNENINKGMDLNDIENIIGLGYQEVINNSVRKDWFIEEDLLKFLSNDLNKNSYNKVMKKNYNDSTEFINDFIEELKKEIKELTPLNNSQPNPQKYFNIAIFFKEKYDSFKFKGEIFHLFYPSTSITNNELFEKNIFSVVQELTYTFPIKDPIKNRFLSFRPDLTFFLNGIYFGYNEIKTNANNQSAKEQGINKISNNYKETYYLYKNIINNTNMNKVEKTNLKRELFWVFDNAIHITTMDFQKLFLNRNIREGFDILDDFENNEELQIKEFANKMNKNFKIYPSEKDFEEKLDTYNWKNYISMLYSKKMIEKELFYYNYIQLETKKEQGKIIKQQFGKIFTPRNKQKYGSDLTIERVKTFVNNENNPNFELEEYENKLKRTPLSIEQQQLLVEEKKKLLNNKYINSILLSYATGFGKTDIISFLAQMTKDLYILKNNNMEQMFKKIILVSDRIELREQINEKLFIQKGKNDLILNASNQQEFKNGLEKGTIIIVNIQKFNNIKEIINEDIKNQLEQNRTIFIIDEIHRSNSNKQHEEMTTLFEDINKNFKNSKRKNIVIGLTATPNDFVLQRFGEYAGCGINGKSIYVPFDTYTMKQAIKNGDVLDFSNSIYPISTKLFYIISEEDKKILADTNKLEEYQLENLSKKIYENEERIKAISKHIVKTLFKITFPSIKRQKVGNLGKGMLAVYSKQAATLYHKWTNYYFKQELNNKEYEKYKDTKIYTIYSYSKDENTTIEDPKNLNNGMNENKVIEEFKNSNNGLIIVVDKLQTGFNEPTLHTLFLDKEVKDITAIQTCSRVNRTMKGKDNCMIYDYSISIEKDREKMIDVKKIYLDNKIIFEINENNEMKYKENITIEFLNNNLESLTFESKSKIKYSFDKNSKLFYKIKNEELEDIYFKRGKILIENNKLYLKLFDSQKDIYSPNYQKNIPFALNKYKNTQISDYKFIEPIDEIKKMYSEINNNDCKKKYYMEHKNTNSNAEKLNLLETKIIQELKEMEETILLETKELFTKYINKIYKMDLTIDFLEDDLKKYKENNLLKFLTFFKNIYNTNFKKSKNIIEIDIQFDDKQGLLALDLIQEEEKIDKTQNKKNKSNKVSKIAIVNKINSLNEKEEIKEEKIEALEKQFEFIFKKVEEISNREKINIKNQIYSNLSEEEIKKSFLWIIEKIKREFQRANISEKFKDYLILDSKTFDMVELFQIDLLEDFRKFLNNE